MIKLYHRHEIQLQKGRKSKMLTEQPLLSGVRSDEDGKVIISRPAKRKFVVNSSSHYIHLDGCCAAKRISPAHLGTAEKPTEKHKLCGFCRNRLLLSLGAAEENAPLEDYADFFRRCGLPWANFEALFLCHNAKMARLSRDIVMFRVREDFWKVIIFDNGSLLVMHNNYTVRDGKRCFYSGFHPQHRPFFGEPEKAFRTVTSYSWKAHVAGQRRGKVRVQTRENISFCKDASGFDCASITEAKKKHSTNTSAGSFQTAFEPSVPAEKRSGPPPTWDELPKTYTELRKRTRSGRIKFRAPAAAQLQTV